MSNTLNASQVVYVLCIDCGRILRAIAPAPEKPICLHCDVVRAAPEDERERIRDTLRPLPPDYYNDVGCVPD